MEQAINIDKDFHGSIWSERTLETVGTYSNSLWDAFASPPAIRYGSQSLVLSKDFYRVMRVSTEYKPVSGRNGLSCLIHDPHQINQGMICPYPTRAGACV
jgi:hypothetical protein